MTDPGMRKDRPKSIEEALRVLDEALAHPAADLKNIVTEEYQNLQSAIGKSSSQVSQVVGGLADTLKSTFESSIQNLTSNLGDVTGDSTEKLQAMAEQGVAMGRDVARRADEEVRGNPWPYIGGIAVGTFALGILLGSKFNSAEPKPKAKPDTSNLN
jgi:ElaB/YqjD/DUF883 family membrane-anchored ribosome-binding protein